MTLQEFESGGFRQLVEPGKFKIVTVMHDDWCLIWVSASCNCRPAFEFTTVTDKNIDAIAAKVEAGERRAQALRRSRRN